MAELVYSGLCRLGEVPEETVQPLLLVEAPRLLFPFARNIICDITRDGGFPALMIGHVDFVQLYRQRLSALQESDSATPGTADAPGQSAN